MEYANDHAALTCTANIETWLIQSIRLLSADELQSPTGARKGDNSVSSQTAVHTDMISPLCPFLPYPIYTLGIPCKASPIFSYHPFLQSEKGKLRETRNRS